MIDCILIDGTKRESSEHIEEFFNFQYALGKHLKNLLDINCFNSIIFLTANNIYSEYRHKHIEYLNIPELTFNNYQHFAMFELKNYCKNDFLMTCQIDGWPLYVDLWKDEFLNYDFIGAPWHRDTIKEFFLKKYYIKKKDIKVEDLYIPDHKLVGNSGFCIRSKEILELCAETQFPLHLCPISNDHFVAEPKFDDWYFSFVNRNHFEIRGIKYAPLDIASQFSIECLNAKDRNNPIAPYYIKNNSAYECYMYSPIECIKNKLSFGLHGKILLEEFLKT